MIVSLGHCGTTGLTFTFATVDFLLLLFLVPSILFLCSQFPLHLLIDVISPQEWAAKQSTLKEEEIDITFSYWDGSGHRRTVRMKKGNWQPLMMYSDVLY